MAAFSTASVTPETAATPLSLPKPYRPSSAAFLRSLPRKFNRSPKTTSPSVFCTLTKQPMTSTEEEVILQRPDSFGRFGKFGGKYVPETLMYALSELEDAFKSLSADNEFQVSPSSSVCISVNLRLFFALC